MNTNEPMRDAIHVPIVRLTAHENLAPGERVGIDLDDGLTREGDFGVVDPFGEKVAAGEACVVYLPQGVTTGVRHVWELVDEEPVVPEVQTTSNGAPFALPIPDREFDPYFREIAKKLSVDTLWLE